jgi:3-isopropylmalate dehydrogenase
VDKTAANAASVRNPAQFDVLVTGNLFGCILFGRGLDDFGLSGLLASASLGDGTLGLL